MTPSRTILVLGGALSGPTAAARARETDEAARVILVERGDRVSYALCGLAYHLSGEVGSIEDLDRERADFFESVYRIEVRTATEVVSLDPKGRSVTLRKDGREEKISYDSLIFALGAAPRIPEIPGLAGENVRPFRTLDDLAAVKEAVQRGAESPLGAARVAVLGGGPLGIEAAEGLVRGGADVTVIEQNEAVLPRFGLQARNAARRALIENASARLGTSVIRAEAKDGRVTKLHLSSGEAIETDFVLLAVGLAPRTELLAAAGACLASDGTVIVNERAETSLAGIYACGVAVSVPQAITGKPVWWPQGAIADKTAQIAGANAAGGDAKLHPALGSMLIRVFDTAIGRTGLFSDEAIAAVGEANFRTTSIHAFSHDVFFPGAAPMHIQLFWDGRDGRILGVEAEGAAGVDKRIDAAAAAISGGLTIEDLSAIDFGYAPPYSAARDPLNVAATVALSEMRGSVRTIAPRALAPRLAEFQVVDVRPAAHRGPDRLPGAQTIPIDALRARAGELDRSKSVVVYCNKGRAGYLAARILSQGGFKDVFNLSGGLVSWVMADLPTERHAAERPDASRNAAH